MQNLEICFYVDKSLSVEVFRFKTKCAISCKDVMRDHEKFQLDQIQIAELSSASVINMASCTIWLDHSGPCPGIFKGGSNFGLLGYF